MNRLNPLNIWLKRRPTDRRDGARGFLTRLRTDVRGNTLAIMGASLVPLLGFTGASVDMARLYVVKVRLQQACDAGVLAGRKFMTSNVLDSASKDKADNFFQNNFRQGWFQTKAVEFKPLATADGQLEATAKTIVPLSIMKFFGGTEVQLETSCQARLDVADVDIMFVLDTTGSMSCVPSAAANCVGATQTYTRPDGTTGYHAQEASGSKMQGLRDSVLSFYDTLAAAADPSTHIRYGFVTYTSTVNVGYQVAEVNSGYLVDSWSYQSRVFKDEVKHPNVADVVDKPAVNQASCTAMHNVRTPETGWVGSNQTWVTATRVTTSWASGVCTRTTRTLVPRYDYKPVTYDTSQFKSGTTVNDPTKPWTATAKWQGCIEERNTTASASFNQSALPPDLNPDLVPSDDATRWRPLWPDVTYSRRPPSSGNLPTNQTSEYDYSYSSLNDWYFNYASPNLQGAGASSCGKAAQRLKVMDRKGVSDYVNAADFKPLGGTYHDVGMIWGARMIAPNGIFKADTSAWPNRNPPNRHVIFMTDGNMAPATYIYGLYGNEQLDQRVTGTDISKQLARHNARFVAACNAAKARNITVWVVAFSSATSLTQEMKDCSSPGKAYYASDTAALKDAFTKIAQQIAELRISK